MIGKSTHQLADNFSMSVAFSQGRTFDTTTAIFIGFHESVDAVDEYLSMEAVNIFKKHDSKMHYAFLRSIIVRMLQTTLMV